jgi:threonine dehydratase
LAAAQHGIAATVVMPNNSATVKVAAVRGYGAWVELSEPNVAAREKLADELIAATGATLIHPYDNDQIIAGQSTAAAEFFEQVDRLDFLLAPVSGGGLLSGTALSSAFFSPGTRTIGVEPAGADDAYRSFRSGKLEKNDRVETIADGLRSQLCARTLAIVQQHVHDIIKVEEVAIVKAMRLMLERMKLLIEPSAAVALAGLLENNSFPPKARIGVILSGGNVDLDALPW